MRVPENLKESLEELAESQGESLSEHIRNRLESDGDHATESERVDEMREQIAELRV